MKIYKYGDNVDTDVIIPARYLNSFDAKELASHAMVDIDPDFAKTVENGDIIGIMILRHEPEPAYLNVSWQAELDYSNVLVIYTFVVNPKFLKRGVGKNMLDFIEEYAMDNKIKSIRLDVYEKNIPAISLYEKCHYKFIDTVSLGLEDIGLNWFKLYEKII